MIAATSRPWLSRLSMSCALYVIGKTTWSRKRSISRPVLGWGAGPGDERRALWL